MRIEEVVKQQNFKNPQQKAWINLVYTYNQLTDQVNQAFKKFDITSQQYNVLRILRGRKGEPALCGEVKEVMLAKNPDVTRLSDRLIKKGLIERSVNEQNRREVQLTITKEGLELLDEIDPELDKQNQFLKNLSDSEAEQLSNLMDKLRS
ncbi:MarR family winged helix-turn-helix transcriptional regulator [Gracilimonas mengyeensis]|uniref:Transcriptional regulator, MarR family n=1 Tax=Gracilimonas mengyeensis TaxID=1302730 RepID=A0A521FEF7_9BACT|nr:MarR family transcriptional regulator [Gracilimonas mengyeensis]SMO94051.1 transcriptional regulator, MarR family [Gracilimonas mengyeensis]